MIETHNVFGLALVVRGHVEATASLGYFCKRINSFNRGNISFDRFEHDAE